MRSCPPDENTILRFRHLLEAHDLAARMLVLVNDTLRDRDLMLKAGSVVDATLIAAPSSTKNRTGTRDPEMRQTKKGKNWYFGMKVHIGADRDSGSVHTVIGTAANVSDVTVGSALLFGYSKVRYRGLKKNTAQLTTLFALANLWLVRRRLLAMTG